MNTSINFLREHVRLQEIVLARDKKIALITSVALGIFLTVLTGVLGYAFTLQSQMSVLAQTREGVDTKIASHEHERTLYLQNGEFLALAKLVMESRSRAWDAISAVNAALPAGTTISAINLSAGNQALLFSFQSTNVFSYKTLTEYLSSVTQEKNGYFFTPGALQRSEDGSYTLQTRLTFTKERAL